MRETFYKVVINDNGVLRSLHYGTLLEYGLSMKYKPGQLTGGRVSFVCKYIQGARIVSQNNYSGWDREIWECTGVPVEMPNSFVDASECMNLGISNLSAFATHLNLHTRKEIVK